MISARLLGLEAALGALGHGTLAQHARRVQEDEHLQQEVAPEGRVPQLQRQQAAAAQVLDGRLPVAPCTRQVLGLN